MATHTCCPKSDEDRKKKKKKKKKKVTNIVFAAGGLLFIFAVLPDPMQGRVFPGLHRCQPLVFEFLQMVELLYQLRMRCWSIKNETELWSEASTTGQKRRRSNPQ